MLPFLLSAGLATAAPRTTGWSAQAIGFGGFDQQQTDGAALGGLRGAAGLQRYSRLEMWATASSEVLWCQQVPYDIHAGELTLTGPGTHTVGGALAVLGSSAAGWVEASPSAVLRSRPAGLQLRIGPTIRAGAETSAGLSPAVIWSRPRSGALSAWARIEAEFWEAAAFPAQTLSADVGGSWQAGPKLVVMGGLGASAAFGDTADWVAGLPPSDTRLLRGRLILDRRLTERIGLRGELTGNAGLGALDYRSVRAITGISARLGRVRVSAMPPEPVRFSLHAPDAATVSISGSFSGWHPVAMTRQPDGSWQTRLSLPSGVHEYIYLVDGEPLTPPEAEHRQDDGFGGENGLLIVGG